MGADAWGWGGHAWLTTLVLAGTTLLWVGLALGLARLLRPGRRALSDDADPVRRLDEELARGRIGVDEYHARRRRLVDGH